jgi:hypothetical protein
VFKIQTGESTFVGLEVDTEFVESVGVSLAQYPCHPQAMVQRHLRAEEYVAEVGQTQYALEMIL